MQHRRSGSHPPPQVVACTSRDPATIYDARLDACSPFYTLQDVNECATSNDGCAQICTNFVGGFNCSCNPGFFLDANRRTCTDVNECLVNNGGCHPNATCLNTPGSFTCSCHPGFTGTGVACSLCAPNTFKSTTSNDACTLCPSSAVTAAPGSQAQSACTCPLGFTGNAETGLPCSACAETSFKNVTGNASCTACAFGYYVPAVSFPGTTQAACSR
jgi:hypothetical protein